jgi:hypothetical protein
MDIFGPVAYVSIGGNKYGFVIVDNYSWYIWVFFMKDKSKVHEIFKKFATRSQNEFEVKIKIVRSDNDTEFKNTNIEEYLDGEGIGHELSVSYTTYHAINRLYLHKLRHKTTYELLIGKKLNMSYFRVF